MSSENYEGDGYGHHQLDLVSNDLAVIVMSFTSYKKWVLSEKYPNNDPYLRDT